MGCYSSNKSKIKIPLNSGFVTSKENIIITGVAIYIVTSYKDLSKTIYIAISYMEYLEAIYIAIIAVSYME